MIETCEIIGQPYSGEYDEILFDNENAWNSSHWSYIKFTDAEFKEWCGVFRGFPKKIAISKIRKEIIILTTDYLWKINQEDGKLLEIEDQPHYKELTVSPNGDFIIADCYNISRISDSIKNKIEIKSPIQMDMIKFRKWHDGKLTIECDEFANWENHLLLELDSKNWKIEVKRT